MRGRPITAHQREFGQRMAKNPRRIEAVQASEALREHLRRQLTKHGLARHPLYGTWTGMMSRCYNPDARGYEDYAGRGIKVCAAWHDVTSFITWIDANLGPRPTEGRWTLDRTDNDGDYEPGNVRWADSYMQAGNKRPMRPRKRKLQA